jgi:hypothetical protein
VSKLLPDETHRDQELTPVVHVNGGRCTHCVFRELHDCGALPCLSSERRDETTVFFMLPDDALKARLRGEL